MVRQVSTQEVQKLVAEGAQIVDVLPASNYLEEHLPGAVNIPMAEIATAPDRLDLRRTVVTYCHDHQCDLSSRAAARLDQLGFRYVCDFVDSKVAWFADGLPSEGLVDDAQRAIARLHDNMPRLAPDAKTSHLRRYRGDWEAAAVVDDHGVVLGLVRIEAADGTGDVEVASIMQPAPPTVRPSISLRELAKSMDKNGERFLLVTKSDGELLGLVRRAEISAA